ncbi:hypothetical protein CMK18_21075 [Candidatus Poribacteria bacterium]|nr:hypothetical protein [Candidatus Poribacteria bacterium]
MNKSNLIVLELNEITFPWIKQYIKLGYLPEFARLIDNYGVCQTSSEDEYENWEPWIQWVSMHTGKTFSQHGVFRLGDMKNSDIEQIWNLLENKGVDVGAICPMNAINNLKAPKFFLPDPWTDTPTTGNYPSQLLSSAVKLLVNQNVSGNVNASTLISFGLAFLYFLKLKNIKTYFNYLLSSKKFTWRKALFLDRILVDCFISLQKKGNPQFSTLFLNSGAHIQHHYLYNSICYDGQQRNPSWYIEKSEDPVLEVYKLYDTIISDIRREFPDARLMIATGLSQDFYPYNTFYWRLIDHSGFMQKAKIENCRVEPRMSRDFAIFPKNIDDTNKIENVFSNCRILGYPNKSVFTVDNRGDSLFVSLVWSDDITEDTAISINGSLIADFRSCVGFVAVKNGHHNPIGYFLDTAENKTEGNNKSIPITEIFNKILNHFE